MYNTNPRLRRAKKTRAKIAELQVTRLSVHRTNTNIYAQIISAGENKVLANALLRKQKKSVLQMWHSIDQVIAITAELKL
jgi:ribosomal protein L18